MQLILTIDTEADNQWDHGRPITTENVRFWPAFQDLCERYEVFPNYMITSEIAGDKQAVKFLTSLVQADKAEVGAHLHPWTTPPYVDQPGLTFNDQAHAFPSELPYDLLQAKLMRLTGQIEHAIGNRPRSFRAGRFGFDQRCADLLSDLGYQVDSSVTPLTTWNKTAGFSENGGPDFRGVPVGPFFISNPGKKSLLEIPLTILITKKLLREFPRWLTAYQWFQGKQNGRFLRLNIFPSQPLWLRPSPDSTVKQLCEVWSTAEALNLPVAVMMFHSSELMPGASPYWPTKQAVSHLFSMLEKFFYYVRMHGGSSCSLDAASQIISKLPRLPEHSLLTSAW